MVRKSKNITRTRIGICINEDCELAKSRAFCIAAQNPATVCSIATGHFKEVTI